MKNKLLILAILFSIKVIATACDTGGGGSSSSSGSSGETSESTGFSLLPKTHDGSLADCSNVQVATQCQAADVRYAQYEECMNLHNGDPQCEGYYEFYETQVGLCESTAQQLGC